MAINLPTSVLKWQQRDEHFSEFYLQYGAENQLP